MLNVLSGGVILFSNPFMVGEEISFRCEGESSNISGTVVDIGLFRTKIKTYAREEYTIPNRHFADNVVLNISRRGKEFRVFEQIGLVPCDPELVQNIVEGIRSVVRKDERVLRRLHWRVVLHQIHPDGHLVIEISFIVEAINIDQYVAIKEDLLLQFMQVILHSGGRLARPQRENIPFSDSVPMIGGNLTPNLVDTYSNGI
mmetsp:Transcript_22352/g.31086  ORF Transcript_22352/g.31086 Transcript_22352/m.31086 type:complete len:201 (-) Transcript_22352:163-765(-)